MAKELVLDVDWNITKAQAKVNKLTREFEETKRKASDIAKEIVELNEKLASNADKKFWAEKALERAEQKVDTLQEKLNKTDVNNVGYEYVAKDLEKAKEEASEWLNTCDKLDKKNKEIRAEIQKQNSALDKSKDKAATIKDNIALAKNEQTKFGKAIKKSNNPLESFVKRVKGLAKRVFIFSVITKAFNAMKDALSGYLTQDRKLSSGISKLKGNLSVIGTTLYESIKPAIEWILKKLVAITQALSVMIAKALGKDINQMRELAQSSEDVADEAERAKRAVAGFDEVNTIDTSTSDTTSGSNIITDTSPLYDDDELSETQKKLKQIISLAKTAALVFGAWKITSFLSELGLVSGKIAKIAFFVVLLIASLKEIFDVTTNWDDELHNGEQTFESIRATIGFIGTAIALIGLGVTAWPVLIVAALAILGTWIDNFKDKIDKWMSTLPYCVYDFVDIFYTAAYGVWDFIKNLFKGLREIVTGDWEKGLKRIGIALLNLLIDVINIIFDAINFLLWPIRELTIAVGKLAGKKWTLKDVALPKIPRIPQLATGAVLPGGSPMLAWVNDQPKGQGYIEGSVENIAAAFEKYLSGKNFGNNTTQDNRPIVIQIDGREVARAERSGSQRLGTQTVTGGFANAY